MQDFHFLRPYWLLLLIPMGVFLVWFWRGHQTSGLWQKICDDALLSYMLIHKETQRSLLPLMLIGLAGCLCTLALAGPTFERQPTPVFKQQKALVIVLDLSSSMLAQDIKPNRLTQAKRKTLDILQHRKEGQTALVVFAGNAHIVSPMTEDTQTIIALVKSLTPDLMPLQGSRADRGLVLAQTLLKQAGVGQAHILFIMDGLSSAAKTAWIQQLPLPYSLSIIGVGHTEGTPIPKPGGGIVQDHAGNIVLTKLNAAELSALAALNNGQYHPLTTTDIDLNNTLTPYLDSLSGQAYRATELKADRWKDIGPWLLLPVLLIAALGFRRGVLVLLLGISVPYPDNADAATWENLWQSPDQQGQQQFQQGHFQRSSQLFQNPRWKSASHYRAGAYEKAIEALNGDESAEADYQRGNALAKLKRYPEALEHFKRALSKDKNHTDAKHNQQSIQDWLAQQPKSDQSDQSDQSSKNTASNPSTPEHSKSDEDASKQDASDGSTSDAANPEESDEPETAASEADKEPTSEDKQADAQQTADDTLSEEQQQALAQWLRRIPEDPGGLLRRKFQAQYKKIQQPYPEEEQAW